jgi:hypothetical protein
MAAALCAPAFARGFEATIPGPLPAVGAVTVSVNPEIVQDRVSALAARSNGPLPISSTEANEISERLSSDLIEALTDAGVYEPGVEGAGELVVTIDAVAATNLQFTDAGRALNLDFGSVALGGAKLSATLASDDGAAASFSYSRYASTLDRFTIGLGVWHDANRAFSIFADRTADAIAENQGE